MIGKRAFCIFLLAAAAGSLAAQTDMAATQPGGSNTQNTNRATASLAQKNPVVQKYQALLGQWGMSPVKFLDTLAASQKKVPSLTADEFVTMQQFVREESSRQGNALSPQTPTISFAELLKARKTSSDLNEAIAKLALQKNVQNVDTLKATLAAAQQQVTKSIQ